jgi:hypothetical protein
LSGNSWEILAASSEYYTRFSEVNRLGVKFKDRNNSKHKSGLLVGFASIQEQAEALAAELEQQSLM